MDDFLRFFFIVLFLFIAVFLMLSCSHLYRVVMYQMVLKYFFTWEEVDSWRF